MRDQRFRSSVCDNMLPLQLVVLAALLSCGCGGATSPSAADKSMQFDMAKLDAAMSERIDKVYARPAVDKAMDTFLDAVFAQPVLQKRGAKLMEALSADPKIAAAAQGILTKIGAAPELQELTVELMKKNPGKSPDEIAEMVGARYEKAFDTPAISKEFETSGQALVAKLNVKWEQSAIIEQLKKQIESYFEDPSREAKWEKRLTELNDGKSPNTERAVELYVDHAWSEERVERFLVALLANERLRREMAEFLDDALALNPVVAELRGSAADIIADAGIQASAVKFMTLMLASKPDEDAIKAEIHGIMTDRKVVQATTRLANILLSSEKVRHLGEEHVHRLADDAELAKLFDSFLNDW